MAGERVVKIKITGDSRGLNTAARSGEESMSRWQRTTEKASAAAGKAAAIGGAAIAAALAGATVAGLEQSQIKAKLAAQLGATGPAAQQAGDAAGNLYARGVVGSMEEAATAVKAIFQNGLVPPGAGQKEIDAVAARVSNLATVLDEDASAVGRAVSQMLRTGIADSAEEAFDILNRGTQLGINKSEDLLDTFNEYGTQFRKLGVDGPTALGLLNQAIKAGARDSDVAADALKEFSLRAIDVGNEGTIAGFKALGLSAGKIGPQIAAGGEKATAALDVTLDRLRGIQDPVKRSAVAVQLFGTQAEDLGDALFAMDPSSATKGLGDLGTAADKASATLEQSAGARVQAFTRSLQEERINALASAIGWMQKNETTVKVLAAVMIPIAAIIMTIVVAMKIWTAAQAAWAAVMAISLGPITLLVIAIGVVIAIIVAIATKTTWFQDLWRVTWGAIKAAAKAVGDWFTGTLWPSMQRAFEQLKTALSAVGSFFKWTWNRILAVIKFARDMVAAHIRAMIVAFNAIRVVLNAVVTYVRGRIDALVSYFRNLRGRVASAARGLFDGLRSAFRSAINWIIDKWNGLSFSLPSINTPFGRIGGTTLSTPNIGRLATGGWAQPGRTYLTGERGPELLSVGRRAYVSNANDTSAMLGSSGSPTVHVYIGDRELTDIVDVQIESSDRQKRRRAGARVAGAF